MKFSFIIPVYNIEKYINKTLDSLVNQTKEEFEIIVIDDGSNDNTYKVAQEILGKYVDVNSRIIKQENGGVSSARNKGLDEAVGEYVIFLDGDDYVSLTLIETISKELGNNKDIICWKYKVEENNEIIDTRFFNSSDIVPKCTTGIELLKNYFSKNMIICTGSAAYRREFLRINKLKYTEGCANAEDQEFNYKCLCRAKKVSFIDEYLSYYVKRTGSISNSYNIRRFDSVYALQRTYEYISKIDTNNELDCILKDKNEVIIEKYLGNLNDCIRHYRGESFRSSYITNILKDIQLEYPELNNYIKKVMESYTNRGILKRISVKSFLLSPVVYYFLIKAKDKIYKFIK